LSPILDADKEGFLRSETSLVQTIGRAARNVDGKVISLCRSRDGLDQAGDGRDNRRREKQEAYMPQMALGPPRSSAGSRIFWARSIEQDHVTVDAGLPRRRV